MSYALVEDVAASWETYEHLAADLERSRPEGLLLHAAGRTDEGVRIIEVWESEEAWRRHAEESTPGDERFAGVPRHLRELRPARLYMLAEGRLADRTTHGFLADVPTAIAPSTSGRTRREETS